MTEENADHNDAEKLQEAYQLLRYIFQALPIHHEQMAAIIEETEKNNLLLGTNFSNLIDEIEQSVKKSNDIKDRILASDLSDSHFEEIKAMLDQLLNKANSVQSSVSEIMVSLQYQDSTRQILTHIQDNLFEMGDEIESLGTDVKMSEKSIENKLQEKIAAKYTMAKERDIFYQVTGINPKLEDDAQKNDDEDEITFF